VGSLLYTQLRAAGGRHGRHVESMASYQNSDFVKLRRQSMRTMRIYVKNNPAKFHPVPI